MDMSAIFSPDRKYRYALQRIWNPSLPVVMFIGLNPSTADEICDDPTVTRCQNYARDWGYGGLYMTNLFAYRSTDPQALFTAPNPVGDETDAYIKKLSHKAGIVVAVWGNHGSHLSRSKAVLTMLEKPHYLKLNKSGEPAHPLYLARTLRPISFS